MGLVARVVYYFAIYKTNFSDDNDDDDEGECSFWENLFCCAFSWQGAKLIYSLVAPAQCR